VKAEMRNEQGDGDECDGETDPASVRRERGDDADDDGEDQKDNDECGSHSNTSADELICLAY
jgi:hypothetical protein